MRLIPSRPQMVISCARAKSLLRSLVRLVRSRSPLSPEVSFFSISSLPRLFLCPCGPALPLSSPLSISDISTMDSDVEMVEHNSLPPDSQHPSPLAAGIDDTASAGHDDPTLSDAAPKATTDA